MDYYYIEIGQISHKDEVYFDEDRKIQLKFSGKKADRVSEAFKLVTERITSVRCSSKDKKNNDEYTHIKGMSCGVYINHGDKPGPTQRLEFSKGIYYYRAPIEPRQIVATLMLAWYTEIDEKVKEFLEGILLEEISFIDNGIIRIYKLQNNNYPILPWFASDKDCVLKDVKADMICIKSDKTELYKSEEASFCFSKYDISAKYKELKELNENEIQVPRQSDIGGLYIQNGTISKDDKKKYVFKLIRHTNKSYKVDKSFPGVGSDNVFTKIEKSYDIFFGKIEVANKRYIGQFYYNVKEDFFEDIPGIGVSPRYVLCQEKDSAGKWNVEKILIRDVERYFKENEKEYLINVDKNNIKTNLINEEINKLSVNVKELLELEIVKAWNKDISINRETADEFENNIKEIILTVLKRPILLKLKENPNILYGLKDENDENDEEYFCWNKENWGRKNYCYEAIIRQRSDNEWKWIPKYARGHVIVLFSEREILNPEDIKGNLKDNDYFELFNYTEENNTLVKVHINKKDVRQKVEWYENNEIDLKKIISLLNNKGNNDEKLIFNNDGKLYKMFKDIYDDEKFKEVVNTYNPEENITSKISRTEIENILFPKEKGMISMSSVVDLIYEECLYIKENPKELMPNFVILGEPGIGKSTVAENIGSCLQYCGFIGKPEGEKELVVTISASELKGAYVGHTLPKVYKMIEEIYINNQILFLDEAYNLLSDQFGREALDALLPILSGTKRSIQIENDESKGIKEKYEVVFKEGKRPMVWLAGYEHETRKMLSSNPGLYRRMIKVKLKTPNTNELFIAFKTYMGNQWQGNIEEERIVKQYFGWATGKEYSKFFSNFAGVIDFAKAYKIRMSVVANSKGALDFVVSRKKTEIKSQYKAVITAVKGNVFEVQSDIETKFDDIAGARKTVKKFKNIVNMLSEKNNYKSRGVNLLKGALLVGAPGTGKTLLARAVAGEIQKKFNEECANSISEIKRVAFISTISTELMSPETISALFTEADEYDACIIFIDEIDIIGRHRNMSGSIPALLIQLMKEMDGFEERSNIFVLAATNDPDSLDPALKRPGRFDQIIEIDVPTCEGRREIIQLYLNKIKKMNNNNNISQLADITDITDYQQIVNNNIEEIAKKTSGFTPSAIKNLINQAGILAANCNIAINNLNNYTYKNSTINSQDLKLNELLDDINEAFAHRNKKRLNTYNSECVEIKEKINDIKNNVQELGKFKNAIKFFENYNEFQEPEATNFNGNELYTMKLDDFDEIIERLMVGELAEKYFNEGDIKFEVNEGRSATAIHEVGHALVSILSEKKPFEKISVISRGNALGYIIPYSKNLNTKKAFLTQIRMCLGGRVAEEIFYHDDISAGAAQDIRQATTIALDMVAKFGMNEGIGPIALVSEARGYLGETGNFICSDGYREKVDQTISDMLKQQLEATRALLSEKKDLIASLARIVVEKEVMSGDEFIEEYKKLLYENQEVLQK